jgi:tRNA (mo5U34)-methyltransferase
VNTDKSGFQALAENRIDDWPQFLPALIDKALVSSRHGNLPHWQNLIDGLPAFATQTRNLTQDTVQIGSPGELHDVERQALETTLRAFMPWRKGPFELFGIYIDTEWRSDWKWQRLQSKIKPLKNLRVLDVGCSNGYFCWRMLGENARLVVGIDPLILNVMQFRLIHKLHGGKPPVYLLPCGLEDLPDNLNTFDTVFSMGVLYHRRSPIDHLLELKACLAPGGELVLETLIIDGKAGESLVPSDRYANMRNVWFIPSIETLTGWLTRCGFDNIRLINTCLTTTAEQRSTDWMTSQSLSHSLDPLHPELTIEGHPAPKRAIFLANSV